MRVDKRKEDYLVEARKPGSPGPVAQDSGRLSGPGQVYKLAQPHQPDRLDQPAVFGSDFYLAPALTWTLRRIGNDFRFLGLDQIFLLVHGQAHSQQGEWCCIPPVPARAFVTQGNCKSPTFTPRSFHFRAG